MAVRPEALRRNFIRMCDDRLCQDCDNVNRAVSEGRACADISDKTSATDMATSSNAYTGEYVANELLSFVVHKLQWMPPDGITQLCVNFYEEDAIDYASKVLFELCGGPGREDRHRKRQGERKKVSTMGDIISLIQRRHNELPVKFVSFDLGNLPPVSFDNIDVCVLLTRMERMQAEMNTLKSVVSAQVSVCNDLKQMHAVRLTDRELSLSSEHRDPTMSELFVELPPLPSGSCISPMTTPPAVVVQSLDNAAVTQLIPVDPVVAQPMAAQRAVAQPMLANPAVAQPMAAHPADAQPMAAHPAVAQPMAAHPAVAQPMATHPAVAQPMAVQPAVAQPMAVHPAIGQPMAAHPAVAQPMAIEPAVAQPMMAIEPAVAQPMMAHPAVAQPMAAHPAVAQPMAVHPAIAQPMAAHPAVAQPMAVEPAVAQPMMAPAVAQPMAAHPAVAQPITAHPAVARLMAPHPAVAQPMAPHPAVAQSMAAQPAVARPMAAHPAVAQPMTTHPAVAQLRSAAHLAVAQPMAAQPAVAQPMATHLAAAQPMVTHSAVAQPTAAHQTAAPTTQDWVAVVKRQRKRKPTTTVSDAQRGKVTTSRREARGLVIGKATDIRIKASMRYANVFVSRLDPKVSCEDLCAYLQDIIQVRPTIEAVKVTDHYSSFHITSECRDPSVFLDANIWPEGSLVRWWRHKKDPASTSRVPSDTSDEHRVHTLM